MSLSFILGTAFGIATTLLIAVLVVATIGFILVMGCWWMGKFCKGSNEN